MVGHLFKGFQFFHAVLLVLSAVAFFIFWVRTRFWLPKYAHLLAAIGLLVGVWSISITPEDAPINKHGPVAKFLFALVLPAMVYLVRLSGLEPTSTAKGEISISLRRCKAVV
jgi:hypothetical protein